MKKLLRGIVDFHDKVRPNYRKIFAKLALAQKPDALLICCSDSRVAPNVFASTDPGDLFVIRNVGNLIPVVEGGSAAAAVEFALSNLDVKDIIVCGHSECGAMCALVEGRRQIDGPNLKRWLKHADSSLERMKKEPDWHSELSPHNRLSKVNVLQQLDNLRTYPEVQDRLKQGTLTLHGWWFDIAEAEVYEYVPEIHRFVVIDETFLKELGKGQV